MKSRIVNVSKYINKDHSKGFVILTVVCNVAMILMKMQGQLKLNFEIPTIIIAFLLYLAMSQEINEIMYVCSVFMLYPSIMGVINVLYPFSFWIGFLIFIPQVIGMLYISKLIIQMYKEEKETQ